MIGEEDKRHYVLIKDFNSSMYDHSLRRGKESFCRYNLQAFNTKEILKRHSKDCFKINDKKMTIMSKNSECFKLKNYEKKNYRL